MSDIEQLLPVGLVIIPRSLSVSTLAVERPSGTYRPCRSPRSFPEAEATMPNYRLFFLTPDDHIFGRHELVCDNDSTALEKAHELAKKHPIEIWQEKRRVGLVKREGTGSNEESSSS